MRTLWRRPPATHGDLRLAAELARFSQPQTRDVAVALVDLGADTTVRTAFIGQAAADTRFEIGSVTKGLTGMLVAEAIERGELALDASVGEYVDGVAGTELATVSVRELCTHTSGLPRLGGGVGVILRALPFAALGLDPYRNPSSRRLVAQAARVPLRRRGEYRYSNLGAGVVGQVLAGATGAEFGALLGERILAPLGMSGTGLGRRGFHAGWGHAWSGQPRQPWTLGAYAPAGGVVSTVADMARLLVALLDGSAPGQESLTAVPDVHTEAAHQASGLFWVIQTRSRAGVPFIWHNGQTGGYSSFIALFPGSRRGVVALANVDRALEQQNIALAAAGLERPLPA